MTGHDDYADLRRRLAGIAQLKLKGDENEPLVALVRERERLIHLYDAAAQEDDEDDDLERQWALAVDSLTDKILTTRAKTPEGLLLQTTLRATLSDIAEDDHPDRFRSILPAASRSYPAEETIAIGAGLTMLSSFLI